jgi:hypothetical protein
MPPSSFKIARGSRAELLLGVAVLAALLLVELWVDWFGGAAWVLAVLVFSAIAGLGVLLVSAGNDLRTAAQAVPTPAPSTRGLDLAGRIVTWIGYVILALL